MLTQLSTVKGNTFAEICSDFLTSLYIKELLIGLKSGLYGADRRGSHPGLNCLFDTNDLMNADIVHEHNVSPLESWNKKLFDEALNISPVIAPSSTKGAYTFWRSAAMKVIVFQFPAKPLHEPLIAAVPGVRDACRRGNGVSSRKTTSRIEFWCRRLQRSSFARRPGSCSAAADFFFKGQLSVMN